ncbi:hypothetical protein SMD22_06490 [Brevibacillus halotolerans]|nr:hypothetical protein SMD22_06490 [Brevibacillus halotolerans]
MILAYIILVVLLVIICFQKLSERRYFRGELHEVHRNLKVNLGKSGFYGSIHGDNYDNAFHYLKGLKLKEEELKKLSLIVKKESSKNNHTNQFTTVIFSVVASVIVMLFSVIFGSTISPVFSNYSNLIFAKVEKSKVEELQIEIQSVKYILDQLANLTLENMVLLLGLLVLIIYIIHLADRRNAKKSLFLQAIVDEVLHDTVKK